MARIPPATKESVPEDQKALFDDVLRLYAPDVIEKFGGAPGPVSVMINVPEVAKRGELLRSYLTRESVISPMTRELAMLVTARELDCQFIWYAHAKLGRESGVRDEIVDRLRDRKELTGLTPQESAVVKYGQEWFRTHQVSRGTFDAALSQFGIRGLVELTNVMAYYALLAFNINAFGVDDIPPDNTELPLPL